MSITIELPEPMQQELMTSWGITSSELPRRVLELVAAEGYRRGALSHHEVGELLNLGFTETEAFLKAHHCPPEYSLQDLTEDRQTLEKILDAH